MRLSLGTFLTYDEAFEIAAAHVGTRRVSRWRGRIRIRCRGNHAFEVLVPT